MRTTLNIIANILKLYFCLLIFFTASPVCIANGNSLQSNKSRLMMKKPLTATLTATAANHTLKANIHLQNHEQHSVYLWSVNAPKDGQVTKELFEIICNGKEVSYIGIMVKRGAPKPEEFIEIKPGDSYSFSINIKNIYQFPNEKNHCVLRYSILNPMIDGSGFFKIESNQVAIDI